MGLGGGGGYVLSATWTTTDQGLGGFSLRNFNCKRLRAPSAAGST